MRAREFIVEYREDITKRQYGEAIVKQMLNGPDSRAYTQNLMFRKGPLETRNYESSFDSEALLKEAFSYIEDGDPTYNWQQKTGGIYVPWIAREYSKGNIKRLEDCTSRVKPALESYHKYKTTRDFKQRFPDMIDIMRTDWEVLEYTMNTYEPRVEMKDRGKSEMIYDGEDARVIIPQNQQAACYYGQGTKWCTASTRGQNMFDYYTQSGPLYIILPKNPSYSGEKYQLHFPRGSSRAGQVMDERDSEVELYRLYTEYPKAIKAIAQRDPAMQDMVLFAKPELVVGIWNAISELVVKAAERISKKPQFSTDLTDSARESIQNDVESIRRMLLDKTYREILEEYKYSAESTIPYLKNDIHYQVTSSEIDDEFKIHIGSYMDYTISVVKTQKLSDPDYIDSYVNYKLYKTVGDWSVALKPQRQHWARKSI